MFLKRLELQGFKTFANRTEIEFQGGITAIVGPNGSGKSNVADAIRWVLGEQSMRTLRGKRTEDVIFNGGAGKPPSGMAEVSITFDNATGWLDSAYDEVVVTRRAYRSGENEYYLNRGRARLRDLLDLLLKANVSPNGYTVIGQGMVDLALSLKPEERRELFEDAAGIRHHYVRLNEARGRLTATEANLNRVRDVIAEVEPRLKGLERRARQLRERDTVRAELRQHLAAWYGHRWLELAGAAERAAAAEREATEALAEARAASEASLEETAELVERQDSLRRRLTEIDRGRVDVTGRGERLERELALRRERIDGGRTRAGELRDEMDGLAARIAADDAAVATAEEYVRRLEDDVSALTSLLTEAEGANDERRERADALRRQVDQARAATARLAQERAALEADLARVERRRGEIDAERERQAETTRRDEMAIAESAVEIDGLRREEQATAAALVALDADVERLRAEAAAARREAEAIALQVADSARQRAAVQGRLEILNDARDGYAGYYAGVRAVMAASGGRTPRLGGVVGLVASLVRVPTELETAIEIALGSHLQDIVVERWQDAEAAVDLLKRTGAGRATFLPLDTLRPGGPTGQVPGGGGVRGLGSQLVACAPEHRPVVEQLLGRTLIVDDLPTARRVLRDLVGGWQIVTLGGELVRTSGAITGGSEGKGDRTLLARERERRELPERLAAVVAAGQSLEAQMAACRTRSAEIEAAVRAHGEDRRRLEAAAARARDALIAANARAERLRREVEWARETGERAAVERSELDARETRARQRLASFPDGISRGEALISALETRLSSLAAATREQGERLGQVRSSVALIEGERRAQTRFLAGQSERRTRVREEIDARRDRVDEMLEGVVRMVGETLELEAARGALEDQRSSLEMERRPVELELAALGEQIRLMQSGEGAVRAQIDALVDSSRAAAIAAQSARDRVEALEREAAMSLSELAPEPVEGDAAADLDGGDPERASEAADAPAASAAGERGAADRDDGGDAAFVDRHDPGRIGRGARPGVDDATEAGADDSARDRPERQDIRHELVLEPLPNADAVHRRIELLRSRLRAIGAVDASAGQEYDDTLARHSFLTAQAGDLVAARRSLEEAIRDLEAAMQQRFEATFEAVAAAFKRHFTNLFGGGTARLVLAESEGGAVPGVEIIAQPPGKRAQSLSLLSGGERALTAVAILFAILDVNPTPVCVLDEVDAALDDANIVRFAQTLRRLAERTQFVVITHNRGTMEAADALYGVSMHDRSTSRTVSLRIADLPAEGVAAR